MCLIIYTLHTRCQHRQYSSTFLCHIARGGEAHEKTEYTLTETRFLPDVQNQPVHQQEELAAAAPECKKRYPTRPVDTFCNACKRSKLKKQAFGEDDPVVASASQRHQFSQPPKQQQQPQQPSSSQHN